MSLVSHALATLAEVKEELNVAGTNRDSVIEECINRATGIVEAYLDREVMNRLSGTDATEVTEYYSLRSLTSRLYLSQFPVISITTPRRLFNVGSARLCYSSPRHSKSIACVARRVLPVRSM